MRRTARTIGELVTRIQHDYLDTPGLALTAPEAQERFQLDEETCRALFDVLADAGVLARCYTDGRLAFLLRRGRGPRSNGPGSGARHTAAARAVVRHPRAA